MRRARSAIAAASPRRLRFLRRRNSNFLDGVGADAEHLAAEVLAHLATRGRLAA